MARHVSAKKNRSKQMQNLFKGLLICAGTCVLIMIVFDLNRYIEYVVFFLGFGCAVASFVCGLIIRRNSDS